LTYKKEKEVIKMLNTKKARSYLPALQPKDNLPFEKNTGVLYSFDPLRVKIQHNKVYINAIAILIDNKVVSLKDSFSELSNVISDTVYREKTGFKKDYSKVRSLYDELSGKDEGKMFWYDK
jgi:hypothetical protein